MKIDFIADTNFLIYFHEGNKIVEPFMDFHFAASFISEVELLGYPGISKSEEIKLRKLIGDCYILEWSNKIKEQTIKLKKKYKIKLPDAIVAGTCLVYNLPLVTADKGFAKIEELNLFLIEV